MKLFKKLRDLNKNQEESHYDEREFWWNEITKQDDIEQASSVLKEEISTRIYSMEGHNGSIKCLCASTKQAEMFSGSFDSSIYVWDLQTGVIKKKLSEQNGSINSLAFSHKMNFLASGSADGTIFIWDLEDYQVLQRFTLGSGCVLSVIFSPSQDLLLASGEESICVWSMQSNELQLRLLNEKQCHIYSLSLVSNSPILFSGHEKAFIRMWDISGEGSLVETLYGHSNSVNCLAVNHSNTLLFSGSMDKSLRVWQLSDRVCIRTIQNAEFSIYSLQVTSNDAYLYAAGGDGVVWQYSLREHYRLASTLKGHSNEIFCLCLTNQDSMIYSGGLDMSVKGWRTEESELVHNFEGHLDGVSAIAVDVSEVMLASGGKDNTIKLWNMELMRCEANLAGHSGKITSLMFSKGREAMFSSSLDSTVKIWSLKGEPRCMQTIYEHKGPVSAVLLAGKGKILCTASYDRSIKLWETSSLNLLGTLEDHEKEVTTIALSNNELLLYSAGMDCLIKIWSMKSMTCMDTMSGHNNTINKLATNTGLMNLISCSKDKTIRVWSSEERMCKKVLIGHKDDIYDICVGSDRDRIFSASIDGTIKIWDINLGECINTFSNHISGVTSIYAFKHSERLVSGSLDRSIKVWDLSIPRSSPSLIGHTAAITKIVLFSAGKYLVSVSLDSTIRFWDTETWKCVSLIKADSPINTCCLNKEETVLFTGGTENLIKIWRIGDMSLHMTIENAGENISSIECSDPNEFTFCASTTRSNSEIKMFHTRSGQLIRDLVGHKLAVTCMLLGEDDLMLITGSLDRDVRIWDLSIMECTNILKGHSEPITCLYIDPRGMFLYSGSEDKTIKIWSLLDRKLVITLEGHAGAVNSLITNRTGSIIFSASSDKSLKVWSTVNFKLLVTMERHQMAVRTIAISPNSKVVYSAGDDKTIQIWNFGTFLNCKDLDLYTLESLRTYLMTETYQEKEFSLRNITRCLSNTKDEYYTCRVNPMMFLASLRFTKVLEMGLRLFGYPSFVVEEEDDLLYRVLTDDDKRVNHLDTLCEFLSNNEEEVFLYNRIIDKLILSTNMKVQKLLQTLFEKSVSPQQGSYLRTKGKLKMHPVCINMNNTKIICTSDESQVLKKNSKTLNSIVYIITKFPIDMRNGSQCARDFFRGLDGCINEVIMSDFRHLINYKWKILRPYILIHAIGFWLLVFFMSFHLVFNENSVLLLVLCIMMNAIYITYEGICAWGEFYSHIFRDMNWLDLACYGINIISLIVNWVSKESRFKYFIFVFDILFYFLRGITYLRIFKQTRYLISMILKVFIDMLSFITILFLFMVATSMISMNIGQLRGETEDFSKAFITTYLLALGEFQGLEEKNTLVEWIQFIVSTIIFTLVLLNLLIAIISNTYEEVKEQREFFDLKEKLGIISDFENFLCKLLRRPVNSDHYKYQLIAYYHDKESSEEMIQELTMKVESLENNLVKRMISLEEKAQMTYQLLRVNRKNE